MMKIVTVAGRICIQYNDTAAYRVMGKWFRCVRSDEHTREENLRVISQNPPPAPPGQSFVSVMTCYVPLIKKFIIISNADLTDTLTCFAQTKCFTRISIDFTLFISSWAHDRTLCTKFSRYIISTNIILCRASVKPLRILSPLYKAWNFGPHFLYCSCKVSTMPSA